MRKVFWIAILAVALVGTPAWAGTVTFTKDNAAAELTGGWNFSITTEATTFTVVGTTAEVNIGEAAGEGGPLVSELGTVYFDLADSTANFAEWGQYCGLRLYLNNASGVIAILECKLHLNDSGNISAGIAAMDAGWTEKANDYSWGWTPAGPIQAKFEFTPAGVVTISLYLDDAWVAGPSMDLTNVPELGDLTFSEGAETWAWLTMNINWGSAVIFNSMTLEGPAYGDTTPPVISLNTTSPMIWPLGVPFESPVTAYDEEDGDLTADLVVSGDTLDVNTVGSYTLFYDVSDSAGNDAEQVSLTVEITPADPADRLPVGGVAALVTLSLALSFAGARKRR